MADSITWDDADEIGQLLDQRFPGTDPDVPSDREIIHWVRELPELGAESDAERPLGAPEPETIAAIRAAWRHARS